VAILAGGSTLTRADVDRVRGACRVVAINRAFELAPWADWLFGCDPTRFWTWYPAALAVPGLRITVRPCTLTSARKVWRALEALAQAGVKILRHSDRKYPCLERHEGASPDPAVVRGNNSLFQLMSVMLHTGLRTLLLLGADMRGGHFHAGYSNPPDGSEGIGEPDYIQAVVPPFQTLIRAYAEADVAVINCSPGSRIPERWWPHMRLGEVL
jgi:hypothetical protein